jgi:hypothetical protein
MEFARVSSQLELSVEKVEFRLNMVVSWNCKMRCLPMWPLLGFRSGLIESGS